MPNCIDPIDHNFYPLKPPTRLESLEPRLLFSAVPIITEFLASNSTGLQDEDGDSSDWIEIFNAGDAVLDLDGWHLTDDVSDLGQWAFPAVTLDAGEYLVVFASSKDRADADGTQLHTNFKLSKGGEYLALVEADGSTIAFEYQPTFPVQADDFSYGVDMSSSTQTLLDSSSSLSYLIPGAADAALGLTWTQEAFNDNAWTPGTAAIGYENNPGDSVNYADLLATGTTIASGTTSLYSRFEFNLSNPNAFNSLNLRMMYDDGFVAYLNGELLVSDHAPGAPQWNSTSEGLRGDSIVVEDFVEFDISDFRNELVAGINILAIHALNFSSGSSDMLMIAELIGTIGTISQPAEFGYFREPTPGSANGVAFDGIVADTQFSQDRGFYTSPISLVISSETVGAMIVYTTDGSDPTVDASLNITNGTLYTGALNVSATTTVRAAAFKLGFDSTNIDTHSYLFLADVLTQSPTGSAPAGFPQGSVNGQVFDYGMDPNIVNDPTWGPQLIAALSDIPTISLVTDTDNLFDSSSGIYVNAGGHGKAWERPTSIELINPDGSVGFQSDAGLRIRGGFSRGDFNPKHSFRLFFRGEYGETKLNFPLFGDGGADSFDAFDLRTAQNYAWSNSTGNNENHNSFLRDIFSRDIQGELGYAHTRGDYYHLYLNGVYWGMYQTEERPEASFASSYFGGDKDTDWDAIKASGGNIEATDGDLNAWGTLSTLVNAGFSSDAAYYAIQGLNADGSDNPAFETHIDIDNLIDFMISVNFTANRDMPLNLGNSGPNNFWAIRPKDGSHGWRWIAHDSEHSMGAQTHSVTHNGTGDISVGTNTANLNPRYIHQRLTDNAEYRSRFADRVQALFFNDGVLTVANAQALMDVRAAQINLAIIAESARWGDQHNEPPKTKNTWLTEYNWLRNTFLAQRGDIVIQQFRNQGWLPDTNHDAPIFSQHGGALPVGQSLAITNAVSSGTIYYTLDGSDPRLAGGAISGSALVYSSAFHLPDHVTVTARLLRSGNWSAKIEADFVIADTVADASNLRITEVHYNPAGPSAAELAAGFIDGDQFEFIELINTSAQTISLDGVELKRTVIGNTLDGITYAFGLVALAPGERIVVVSDFAAFTHRYGGGINVAGEYDGKFANNGEVLRVIDAQGTQIQQFKYDDDATTNWPTTPDGDGPSLVVLDTNGDYDDGNNWTPSNTTHGTPGSAEAAGLTGDVNGDGFVDGLDLDQVFQNFGALAASSTAADEADLNNDGTVGIADLSLVLNNFGNGTPPAAQPTSDTNDDPGSTPGNNPGSSDPAPGEASGNGGGDDNTDNADDPADAPGNAPEDVPAGDADSEAPQRPTRPARPAQPIPPTRQTPPTRDTAPASTPALTRDQQRAAATRPHRPNALALAKPISDTSADTPADRPTTSDRVPAPTRRFDALDLR